MTQNMHASVTSPKLLTDTDLTISWIIATFIIIVADCFAYVMLVIIAQLHFLFVICAYVNVISSSHTK